MLGRRFEGASIHFLAAAGLFTCCAVPWLALAWELDFRSALSTFGTTLGSARSWYLFVKTLGFALLTTVGTLMLGIPLGVLLGKSDVRGRRWALGLHLFPVFLPPFFLALGWFQLLGRGSVLGSVWTSRVLFSPVGLVTTLTLAFTPIVSALTALGLRGIEPSLEEAAWVVGSPWRAVTRILLPLAWPTIALSALIVFAFSLSEIGVPMFLGVRTYSAAVFTRLGGMQYAPGEAVALVLPLLALGLALVAVDRWLVGTRSSVSLGLRSAESPLLRLGRFRGLVSAAVWIVPLFGLLPLVGLMVSTGARGLVEAARWVGGSVTTSLLSSFGAATSIVVLGGVLGHALAREKRFASLFDALVLLAFLTPASVLGVGLITAWNRPGTHFIYTSMSIVVLGLTARYAFIGLRTLRAVFLQSSAHYEEAAAVFGSGFCHRLLHIVLPMHARGILAAWALAFVFCLRDLDTVVVFYPPGLEPLVVRIFTLEANGPESVITGLSVIHLLLTALLLVAVRALLRMRWGSA